MSDDPILTRSQVRRWQIRQQEIGHSIRSLQDEAKDIERKLDAVRVLLGELPSYPDSDSGHSQDHSGQHDTTPEQDADVMRDHRLSDVFSETVVLAVGRIGGSPRPNEIRAWLRKHGVTEAMRAQADKPYFYSVLMRHAANGRLIKEGDGYRLPMSSPQGEAGGVTPPADSVT